MIDELQMLRRLGTIRPFHTAPPELSHRVSPFRAPFRKTAQLLDFEFGQVVAAHVVFELAYEEIDLRLDGLPRAHAYLKHQAVRISFDSFYGPLRYETGEYGDWRDNVRAIALSLQSLRAVDRYGVSRRGEQYRGWAQLPTGTDPADSIQTHEQAQAVIDNWGDGDVRAAIRATHPDTGGDATEFRKVMRAKELLAV